MSTLTALLRDTTNAHATRTAFIDTSTGARWSFASFWERANATARLLNDMLDQPGPVGILGRNSVDWVLWEAAITLSGRACLPMNFRLSAGELDWQLHHADAAGLVYASDFQKPVDSLRFPANRCIPFAAGERVPATGAPLPMTRPDDIQRIMYTSATTGEPKGVLTPHHRVVDNAVSTLANQLEDATTDSCFLITTPLTHMAVGYLWPMFALGARSVVLGSFTPEAFCTAVLEHRVTHTLMVPTMLRDLVDHLEDDPKRVDALKRAGLRAIWYAGASTSHDDQLRAERVLGELLNQQYGLTELWSAHRSMCATYIRSRWSVNKPRSCGRPLVGTEVAVLDEDLRPVETGVVGELAIRSTGAVAGYLNDPEATASTFVNGWVLTGDLAKTDSDGYVYIVDRKKDVIISGGFNIYSAELENALSTHPAVAACAAVAGPDPRWGETPWVFVVTSDSVTEQELFDHIAGRLSRYKQPSRIVVTESLPLGPTGKVLKRQLRERLHSLEREETNSTR